MGAAAGGAVAAAAALANAIKASGVLVRVTPGDFLAILKRVNEPLVVIGKGGYFKKHYRYLTSYKGLAFHTQSAEALVLPSRVEIIGAKQISIPEM
jgi:hypothetical protein